MKKPPLPGLRAAAGHPVARLAAAALLRALAAHLEKTAPEPGTRPGAPTTGPRTGPATAPCPGPNGA